MEPNHMLLSEGDDPAQLMLQQHQAQQQEQQYLEQQQLQLQLQQNSASSALSMSPQLPPLYNNQPQQRASPLPPPPSYAHAESQSHDPSLLAFPDVPTTELPPLQLNAQNDASVSSLPSLSTIVTSTSSRRYTASSATSETSFFSDAGSAVGAPPRVQNWPSLNPLTAYYTPSHAQPAEPLAQMDVDVMSTTTTTTAVGPGSPDRWGDGRASSVSLDDPDVRMAAEALGDLRADFVSSPPNRNSPLPRISPPRNALSSPPTQGPGSEPLLSLLTTSHPLLAKTIEGTTTAYNTSKNLSPRFKSGVEYVEGYLTPIANTVGSVGRVTGVEGGVRWFLRGAGRRHQRSRGDLESGDGGSHKRRRVGSGQGRRNAEEGRQQSQGSDDTPSTEQDLFGASKERRMSNSTVDTLPAYDDEFRSPDYSEVADGHARQQSEEEQAQGQLATTRSSGSPATATPTAWQSRLIMSTSGLSIAMSEESLRSLKYCLRWLKWANEHIGRIIGALKDALERFDNGDESTPQPLVQEDSGTGPDRTMTDASQSDVNSMQVRQDQGELAVRIAALRSDVLKTLRDVVDTVSRYAGGALPENARLLVRRHLTSLPQRFRLATQQHGDHQQHVAGTAPGEEKDVREGAQRVLVLAKEGLDMMAQVSGVLDGTIVSAEEWCDRLGRKKREQREELGADSGDGREQNGHSQMPPLAPMAPLTGVGVDGDVKMV